MLRVNEETNREELVHPKPFARFLKFTVSAAFIFGMMVSTVLLAYICTTVGTLGALDHGDGSDIGMVKEALYDNFYVIISSVGNLATIQVMGGIYQSMAMKLNNWENHRTQLEFDNQ